LDRRGDGDAVTLALAGKLGLADAKALWEALHVELAREEVREVRFDVGGLARIDGTVAALLAAVRAELASRGAKAEFVGAAGTTAALLDLYGVNEPPPRRKRRRPERTLAQIGRATQAVWTEAKLALGFVGSLSLALRRLVGAPGSLNWREAFPLAERAGADAVPIILLINFLVGLVTAYQSAPQLKQLGANIFVADLVGVAMTRELAPLMTAIIVAGRTGAAYAAELGSMTVNEEVDALRTMGLPPMRWLVLPRMLALAFVMPLLVMLGDIVSVLGGLVIALSRLDLTAVAYLNEIQKAVTVWDVISGLLKSAVFGVAIATIACQQGLAASGGAEGVGKRTTSSVVTTLLGLIVVDAFFTVLFEATR